MIKKLGILSLFIVSQFYFYSCILYTNSIPNSNFVKNPNIVGGVILGIVDEITHTIGGKVSGMTGQGLVLSLNDEEELTVNSNGNFVFSKKLIQRKDYEVKVVDSPAGEVCTASNNSGKVTSDVTNIEVVCSIISYKIGGSISGLTSSGLILQNNSGDNLTLFSGETSFTFPTKVAEGGGYKVTIFQQPTGQTCTPSNNSGTANSDIKSIMITCSSTTFSIAGKITGLENGDTIKLSLNSGYSYFGDYTSDGTDPASFIFGSEIAYNSAYDVDIITTPTGKSCLIANDMGTATADVTNINVTCSKIQYTITVLVHALTGDGLNVKVDNTTSTTTDTLIFNNSSDTKDINGDISKTSSLVYYYTNAYTVSLTSIPSGDDCEISGSISPYTSISSSISTSNVIITVNCSKTVYSASVKVQGYNDFSTGTLDVKVNNDEISGGNQTLSFTSNGTNSSTVVFNYNDTYTISILSVPTGDACKILSNGLSSVSGQTTANFTITVDCSKTNYTLSGNVLQSGNGLNNGESLTLTFKLNGVAGSPITVNGSTASQESFTLTTTANYNDSYTLQVTGQPTDKTCDITGNTGGILTGTVTGNLATIQITCIYNTFSISGNVTGLATGESVSLTNTSTIPSNTESLTVNYVDGNEPFNFTTKVRTYAVAVASQPSTSKYCVVTNGSGTATDATGDITNIQVDCRATYSISGYYANLSGGITIKLTNLYDGTSETKAISAGNGSFSAFTKTIADGLDYKVEIIIDGGQTCSIAGGSNLNGSGTISSANVTDIKINCNTTVNTVMVELVIYNTSGSTINNFPSSGSLDLNLDVGNNGSIEQTINTNSYTKDAGFYTFTPHPAMGSSYLVSRTRNTLYECSVPTPGLISSDLTIERIYCSPDTSDLTFELVINGTIPPADDLIIKFSGDTIDSLTLNGNGDSQTITIIRYSYIEITIDPASPILTYKNCVFPSLLLTSGTMLPKSLTYTMTCSDP